MGLGIAENFQGTNLTGCLSCSLPNCHSCNSNYQFCEVCESGFIRANEINGMCMNIANWNCSNSTDFVGCTSCMPGTGIAKNFDGTSLNACAPCRTNGCAQCSNDYTVCEKCLPNSILSNSTCVDISAWNCVESKDNIGCTVCNSTSGFWRNSHGSNLTSCAPCVTNNCGNCTNNFRECHGCLQGFALAPFVVNNTAACIDCSNQLQCPGGLCNDYVGCLACSNGYYKTSNVSVFGMSMCANCPQNCTGCANATWCTDCENDHNLVNTTINGIRAQVCAYGKFFIEYTYLLLLLIGMKMMGGMLAILISLLMLMF